MKVWPAKKQSVAEGKLRMTIQTLEEKPVIKFYVPSMTKGKQPIPKEKSDAIVAIIEARVAQQNGGWTTYKAKGGYLGADGAIHREKIQVVETLGENPFSEREISDICKVLDQESLLVQESGKSRAYFYDGEIRESKNFYQEVIPEGEIIRYHKEPVPYGKGYKILREITDSAGSPLSFDEVDESELCSAAFYGDQSLLKMMAYFGISH
jgi:hypothetical protein